MREKQREGRSEGEKNGKEGGGSERKTKEGGYNNIKHTICIDNKIDSK